MYVKLTLHIAHNLSRRYSNGVLSSSNIMNVFDRKTKRIQRNRTALLNDYEVYDYIKEEVGWRMSDRLSDIRRRFDVAVDVGCARGHIGKNILLDTVGALCQLDSADRVLAQSKQSSEVPTCKMVADEENLPFRPNCLDLAISSMSLHWVNNLPGTFKQIFQALRNDGCFMGAMFGGETLHELRVSLQLAEIEKLGGFSAHVSPFTSAQDLGALLSRTGFVMLTIDIDEIVVSYPSLKELLTDLKGMGESNCAWSRRPMIQRQVLEYAGQIYKERYGNSDNNSIPAMFEILYFIAWKPDPSQPKAAERGSGQMSLKDIGKLDEVQRKVKEIKEDLKGTDTTTKSTLKELESALEKARKLPLKDD